MKISIKTVVRVFIIFLCQNSFLESIEREGRNRVAEAIKVRAIFTRFTPDDLYRQLIDRARARRENPEAVARFEIAHGNHHYRSIKNMSDDQLVCGLMRNFSHANDRGEGRYLEFFFIKYYGLMIRGVVEEGSEDG